MTDSTAYQAGRAAAFVHAAMCIDSRFGYTQGSGRWGAGFGRMTLEYQGQTLTVPVGDYDCSSSVVRAWQVAIAPTEYAGALGSGGYGSDGWHSWYTGNIPELFTGSGLFTIESPSFPAQVGDLYLNRRDHVAMCQTDNPVPPGLDDLLSEFVISETGGIYGQLGDQTGGESIIRPYYDWPGGWDMILHYNGKADINGGADMATPAELWGYKNKELTTIDAYAHLLEMHAETRQALKELAAIGSEVAALKRELQALKSKN